MTDLAYYDLYAVQKRQNLGPTTTKKGLFSFTYLSILCMPRMKVYHSETFLRRVKHVFVYIHFFSVFFALYKYVFFKRAQWSPASIGHLRAVLVLLEWRAAEKEHKYISFPEEKVCKK